jgi:hypothetical protein
MTGEKAWHSVYPVVVMLKIPFGGGFILRGYRDQLLLLLLFHTAVPSLQFSWTSATSLFYLLNIKAFFKKRLFKSEVI